jgi:hypothetical protein
MKALSGGKVKRPKITADVPPSIAPIVEACWQQEPASRPTFPKVRDLLAEALSSSIFSNDKQKEPKNKKIRIFLSYRRSHSGEARAMKMELEKLDYDVFFDLDRDSGLGVGPFQQQLEQTLANTDVVLVLITAAPSGPQSDVESDGGRFNMSSTETMKEYARLGWTDSCGVEVENALKANKIVIPVYSARHGTSWIGQQLNHLRDLPNLSPLRSLNAYDISDSLFVESIGVIDKHVKNEMTKTRGGSGGSGGSDGGSGGETKSTTSSSTPLVNRALIEAEASLISCFFFFFLKYFCDFGLSKKE